MYYERKLKPAPFPKELLIPFIVLPSFVLLIKIASFSIAYLFLLPVFVVVGLINLLTWMRTRNLGHLFVLLAMSLMTVMCIIIGMYGKEAPKPFMVAIIIPLVMTFPPIWYMTFTKRTKWRKREMLELAAFGVTETESGFTERPFPAGQINFTRSELYSFIEFVRKTMIALPLYNNEKVIFVITTDYSFILGFTQYYEDKTWLSIDNNGQILTHISRKDYMLYRDDFSYDKLCESLGNQFVEFFDYYRKGEGQRVIDRMNNLRLNPITEG